MRLLRIENWKLFLLILWPVAAGLAFRFLYSVNHDSVFAFIGQSFTLLFVAIFIYWLYQMGTHLHSLEPNQHHSLLYFKLCMIFGAVYRIAVEVMSTLHIAATGQPVEIEKELWIVPIHVCATAATFYVFYMIAKWLASAEEKQVSAFSAFSKTFILIVAFPIGLWFIQPRLNKLFR